MKTTIPVTLVLSEIGTTVLTGDKDHSARKPPTALLKSELADLEDRL
jgi:hypothetical protein